METLTVRSIPLRTNFMHENVLSIPMVPKRQYDEKNEKKKKGRGGGEGGKFVVGTHPMGSKWDSRMRTRKRYFSRVSMSSSVIAFLSNADCAFCETKPPQSTSVPACRTAAAWHGCGRPKETPVHKIATQLHSVHDITTVFSNCAEQWLRQTC